MKAENVLVQTVRCVQYERVLTRSLALLGCLQLAKLVPALARLV